MPYKKVLNFRLCAAILAAFPGHSAIANDTPSESGMPSGPPENIFAGDYITIGLGAGYRPSYAGSDDYDLSPAPIIQGSIEGFDFGARGPGIYVDMIRDSKSRNKVEFILGPQMLARLDRNNDIKDPVVALLGKRDVGIELGITSGVSVSGFLSPRDKLTLGVDAGWDVAGAHNGAVISPSVSYSKPLSRAAFANLSLSAKHVSDNFADTYYTVDAAGSIASGLPMFKAKGGWQSYGATLLTGYDLSGNALDGGWSLFGLASYSRLTGDAKRSPVTAIRGSADQIFVAAGVAYTF